ncbi:hypothetical protein FEM48_Zijuj01G0211100 [Ziziphus jujuba var. spinosa]|uniref:Uncharacterized protein n=1 Tax=Ziziphus jujuba var. spinosa TaxID=714518 RepID=A0A978W3K0_ZIZJJ|nr:hypothetical protein FEM48_Zijuj01G0211100 [Ziziphus jujuba var. spinosa]
MSHALNNAQQTEAISHPSTMPSPSQESNPLDSAPPTQIPIPATSSLHQRQPVGTTTTMDKIGWNLKTYVEHYLTSWKSSDDPSIGDFSFHIDIKGMPQVIVSKGTTRTLRLGPWNGVRLNGVYVRGNTVYGSNEMHLS